MDSIFEETDSDKFEQAKNYFLLGMENFEKGMYEEAEKFLFLSLNLLPQRLSTLTNLSAVLIKLGKLEKTHEILSKGINLYPTDDTIYLNFGNLHQENKNWQMSLDSYEKAIEIKPDNADAYNNRGNALIELKRVEEAIASYDRAIEIKPDYADAFNNRGNALIELKRVEEAIASCERAIEIKPDYADAYYNRGNALIVLNRVEEAIASYDRATEIKLDYADAYNNRGNALIVLNRVEEAIASYDRAIEIKPDYAEAYNNRGAALQELKRYDEAFKNYDKAIALKSDYAEAYNNRGVSLQELKRYDEALKNYNRAIAIKSDYEYLFGKILHIKMFMCDWQNFEADLESLSLRINEDQKSILSFPVLALIDSLAVLHKTSAIWIKDKHPIKPLIGSTSKNVRKNKIRIGYYSADFHDHATAHLMTELFELHDKNNFELIAFSFGPDTKDEMRQRLAKAFEQFIDVRFKSDKDIALMSRDMGIDVAVDLKGCTKDHRMDIFSYRAAPIQVNYIGFPGTMAAEYIDYIIADPTLIPIESQQHYSEKVVYLPNSYQVNDRQRAISEKIFTKEELGLPNDSFTFCCFNNNYKITPHTFDGWVRILKAVEGSVLWLFEDNPTAVINLRNEAQTKGIDPNRLVFAKRMKLPEHLARHKAADLFIDTLPYNAHTTASDALWAGLPVLTCMGESFASRVAASLLNAIELPELIATTQEQYEATAIELATNPEKLKAIKDKLEKNRLTTALFDTPRFTKHIEAAYTQMYERNLSDLPPDHIYIED